MEKNIDLNGKKGLGTIIKVSIEPEFTSQFKDFIKKFITCVDFDNGNSRQYYMSTIREVVREHKFSWTDTDHRIFYELWEEDVEYVELEIV